MVAVLRNIDLTIKTFSERGEDFVLAPGETVETLDTGFAEYAGRLKISAGGRSGETLFLPAGSAEVEVLVDCPGKQSVTLEVNKDEVVIPLADWRGRFVLPLVDGTTYVIQPRYRKMYCAAGEALMAVVVGSRKPG